MKTKKSKKSGEDLTAPSKRNAISYQVSIRGRGVSKLSKKEANAIVLARLDDTSTEPYQVRIQVWRSGQSLDWQDNNPRAEILRANLRRALQKGRIDFRKVGGI